MYGLKDKNKLISKTVNKMKSFAKFIIIGNRIKLFENKNNFAKEKICFLHWIIVKIIKLSIFVN